jgi:hypothetical protein
MTRPFAAALLAGLAALASCGGGEPEPAPAPPPSEPSAAEPDSPTTADAADAADGTDAPKGPARVTVDHVLVGVKSPRFRQGRHDAAKAKALAYDLLDSLRRGADWDVVKREFSEDPPPGGPYALANHGVSLRRGEKGRGEMVKGFGDVAFSLEVGEIGIVDHGPDSPFGYHVVKRTK